MSDINSERPFTIAVADSELELLRAKLALARWPDEVSDAGWDYGAPLADVHRLAMYWKDGYDWRKAEAALNADLPMFTRDIDVEGHSALNVHYVHQRSSAANAIPLIFVHGWPGSFIEVRKVLPLLTSSAPNIPTFHVVALSLPGYGWSEAPRKKGFSPVEMAEIGHRLMLALGYSEYVCQGGDWGGHITRLMASKYGPKHVKAWHTNMPFALPPRLSTSPLRYIISMLTPYTKAERSGLERAREFDKLGKGYNLEQSTKPQTIGYSLSDSPVGLLAWIYEKLVGWSDNYQWTDDEVLTWISIYWFSRAGPTAAGRIYYENRLRMKELIDSKVEVRTGFSRFPRDIHHPPRSWSHAIANVVQDVYHERGGHFAAYETPELLVGDLRKMFAKGGPAYRCVKNKL